MPTHSVPCDNCGTIVHPNSYHMQHLKHHFCDRNCYKEWRQRGTGLGENSPSWKGGKRKNQDGYIALHNHIVPSRFASMKSPGNNYVGEHRIIMAEHLDRPLYKYERVHHKNGRKDDNRIENLELWANGHPSGMRIEDAPHCQTCTCGEENGH